MEDIGIVIEKIASKYLDMDNFKIEFGVVPKYFIVSIGDAGLTAREYKDPVSFDFTMFSKEDLGFVYSFNTNKPDVFGTGLRLKLVGMFNNKDVTTIYIPDSTELDNVYVFEDTYNKDQTVYIPESVIISPFKADSKTKFEVTCDGPDDVYIFKEQMRSLNISYKEV